MRTRLLSLPVFFAAVATCTVGGLGAAYAAPSSAMGHGHAGGGHTAGGQSAGGQGPGAHWVTGGRAGVPAGGTVLLIRRAASTAAPLVTDNPRGRSKRGLPAPRMTAAMSRANRIRQATAERYVAAAHRAVARDLRRTQLPQRHGNFCGPATVTEMLLQMNVRFWQRAAAKALGTDASGTDWSNRHGFPVPKVLNAHQDRHSYVAVALPWSPTRRQIAVFRTDLISDIGHGAPIAGNGYEVAGGPHLVGHPPGQTILHWFDIRGYSRSGALTSYEDSVHGASSIGWSASVPAYSTLPTSTVVIILGARGYVW